MVGQTTIEPSGPTITRFTFNINEVKQALIDYAESHGKTIPNGAVAVANLANKQAGTAATLQVTEQA